MRRLAYHQIHTLQSFLAIFQTVSRSMEFSELPLYRASRNFAVLASLPNYRDRAMGVTDHRIRHTAQ